MTENEAFQELRITDENLIRRMKSDGVTEVDEHNLAIIMRDCLCKNLGNLNHTPKENIIFNQSLHDLFCRVQKNLDSMPIMDSVTLYKKTKIEFRLLKNPESAKEIKTALVNQGLDEQSIDSIFQTLLQAYKKESAICAKEGRPYSPKPYSIDWIRPDDLHKPCFILTDRTERAIYALSTTIPANFMVEDRNKYFDLIIHHMITSISQNDVITSPDFKTPVCELTSRSKIYYYYYIRPSGIVVFFLSVHSS